MFNFNKAFKEAIKPYYRRIMMTVARGIVTRVDDGKKMQIMQLNLQAEETRANLERFQQYGITSNPHDGAEAAVVFVGGSRDHGLILAVDDRRYRLQSLEKGEVAIYTDEGDKILLGRGNNIQIETNTLTVRAADKARFETPVLECTGEIIDNVPENTNTMSDMRDTYNDHRHEENPQLSGLTDIPNDLMD